ncbi:hypothetical protein [Colwellia sp. M166]|nr:hypothetical protein [Colwellia sp. M166]|tara:strand:+ start:892 stop:1038 length:147 start_codon:yes stop_codon:yes gene_type:complete
MQINASNQVNRIYQMDNTIASNITNANITTQHEITTDTVTKCEILRKI